MKVADLMTSRVATIGGTASCWDAAIRMARSQVRHLPVVDGACMLIGIITDRDLRSFVLLKIASARDGAPVDVNAALVHTPVSMVMSTNVVCVGPEDSLALAVRLMAERRIGSIAVVNDGRLVGILTEYDVICHLSRRDVFHAREVESVVFPAA